MPFYVLQTARWIMSTCHPPATEFPLDGVAVGEGGREAGKQIGHPAPPLVLRLSHQPRNPLPHIFHVRL
jgi:hypothetical protein